MTPVAASMSSNACSTGPRPTTTDCSKSTPNWPRPWRCFAATSSASSRERFLDDPGQGHLFDIPELIAEPEPPRPARPTTRPPRPAAPARRGGPAWIISLTSASSTTCPRLEKTCSCCGEPKRRIGEDESRELDFIPARLEVQRPHPAQVHDPYAIARRVAPAMLPQHPISPIARTVSHLSGDSLLRALSGITWRISSVSSPTMIRSTSNCKIRCFSCAAS